MSGFLPKAVVYSEVVEQLAGAIADEIYLDVAKWRLYLGTAKLEQQIAEQLVQSAQSGIALGKVQAILQGIPIPIGGGKRQIPLADFIPDAVQDRLWHIAQEYLA